MRPPTGSPDWTNPADYSWLAAFGRPAYAWEWLRRQPRYCAAARTALDRRSARNRQTLVADPLARMWNLHTFEDPSLDASQARPIWRVEAHPYVLEALAEASPRDRDSFELSRFASLVSIVEDSGVERILLSDGRRSIRLDARGVSLAGGPVRLNYRLHGVGVLSAPLLVLRQLHALNLNGAFSSLLHPTEQRSRRMLLLLRTFDALQSGASQRDIAHQLINSSTLEKGWRAAQPSLRSQAQRLAKGATCMANGAFWQLLDPGASKHSRNSQGIRSE